MPKPGEEKKGLEPGTMSGARQSAETHSESNW